MTDRTQTRDNAYRWGMLMWFNQLLLDDNRGRIQADAAKNRR